jgi:hypothetical protein
MAERPALRGLFILDEDDHPVRATSLEAWAAWMETHDARRVVQVDRLDADDGDTRVSTVFLGLDHNWTGQGPPLLWETMVFGTPLDGEQVRYASRAAALAGHARLLRHARRLIAVGAAADTGRPRQRAALWAFTASTGLPHDDQRTAWPRLPVLPARLAGTPQERIMSDPTPTPKMTGLCSRHRDGEDPTCDICYPQANSPPAPPTPR